AAGDAFAAAAPPWWSPSDARLRDGSATWSTRPPHKQTATWPGQSANPASVKPPAVHLQSSPRWQDNHVLPAVSLPLLRGWSSPVSGDCAEARLVSAAVTVSARAQQ